MWNEAKFTSKLIRFLHNEGKYTNCAIEVKFTKGSSIQFAAVKEHQRHALLEAENNRIIWKIPDCGFQNPFDVFSISGKAYIVLAFYRKNKETIFFFININTFLFLEKKMERKSLTVKMLREIKWEHPDSIQEFNF